MKGASLSSRGIRSRQPVGRPGGAWWRGPQAGGAQAFSPQLDVSAAGRVHWKHWKTGFW